MEKELKAQQKQAQLAIVERAVKAEELAALKKKGLDRLNENRVALLSMDLTGSHGFRFEYKPRLLEKQLVGAAS